MQMAERGPTHKREKGEMGYCAMLRERYQLTSEQIAEARRRADEFERTNKFSPPDRQWPDVIDLNLLWRQNAPANVPAK